MVWLQTDICTKQKLKTVNCKALINTTSYGGKRKRKWHQSFSDNAQFPWVIYSYNSLPPIQYLFFNIYIYLVHHKIFSVSGLCYWPFTDFITFPHKWHFGKLLQCSLCAILENRSVGRLVHLWFFYAKFYLISWDRQRQGPGWKLPCW